MTDTPTCRPRWLQRFLLFSFFLSTLSLLSGCDFGEVIGDSDNTNDRIDVPNPTVEGPIEGNLTLLGNTSLNLESVGYQQSEYFFSGNADSYVIDGEATSDGRWKVEVDDSAAYKSRMVVYRPIDDADFNGTVVIEWLNVSGGPDTAAEWIASHVELIRSGYIWVGISAQYAGIEGGGVNFSGLELHLKSFNEDRYSSLSHPGDKYAFDIFSQAVQAIVAPEDIDILSGVAPDVVLAVGESQSADFLTSYINALAKRTQLVDGFMVHSRFRGTVGMQPSTFTSNEGIDFLSRDSVNFRSDLDVPVLVLEMENDILEFGAYSERQPDTDLFRWWEVAGAAHADVYVAIRGRGDVGTDPSVAAVVEQNFPFYGCDKPVNAGPQHFVAKAAIAGLNNWVRTGVAPTSAPRLQLNDDATAFLKDDYGNVLGGIRTPYVDVPVATLSGSNDSEALLCKLFGSTAFLDETTLSVLYPSHETFTTLIADSVDAAVLDGFLLQADGQLIKDWAESSDYGN